MLEEFLEMDIDWRMQSHETVNGVEATHYTFDQTSIRTWLKNRQSTG